MSVPCPPRNSFIPLLSGTLFVSPVPCLPFSLFILSFWWNTFSVASWESLWVVNSFFWGHHSTLTKFESLTITLCYKLFSFRSLDITPFSFCLQWSIQALVSFSKPPGNSSAQPELRTIALVSEGRAASCLCVSSSRGTRAWRGLPSPTLPHPRAHHQGDQDVFSQLSVCHCIPTHTYAHTYTYMHVCLCTHAQLFFLACLGHIIL